MMPRRPVPDLLVGLGNPLMGDDGIGRHIAEILAADPRLPDTAEALPGGTDLLRLAHLFEGRRRVILVDAMLGPDTPGSLLLVDDIPEKFDAAQGHVHGLSAVLAVELLRAVNPALHPIRFSLAGISIAGAALGAGLSAPLTAALPAIIAKILEILAEEVTVLPRVNVLERTLQTRTPDHHP